MKQNRLDKIKELISENRIETQDELCKKLIESGYDVTQATVSRDIRKLSLTKVADKNGGRQYYTLINEPDSDHSTKFNRVLKDSYLGMSTSLNIIVIRTVSGMAMAFGAALDNINLEEILGCVAGDDTVICVVRSLEDVEVATRKIQELL